MKKKLTLIFLYILSTNAVTPFNGFFVSGGILLGNNKLEIIRILPPAVVPPVGPAAIPEKKFDKDTASSPVFSASMGFLKLMERCIILGISIDSSYTTKNSYMCDNVHIGTKTNRFGLGLSLLLGVLVSGKSFIFINPSVENLSISLKPTDAPETFKKNAAFFALKIGVCIAIDNNKYLNVYAGMGTKSFSNLKFDINKVKINKKIIGTAFIIRISPLSSLR